jgi:sterol desaturase/sphingolipid hydroxylase (fatty acid hydroxylase superfamily)
VSDETEWRLRLLEGRLDAYHEWLEASLTHDRRFQLSQTWAISGTLVAVATAAAALYAAQHWLAVQGWLPGTIAAAAGWIGATLWARWAHRENERKLSNLPKWGAAQPLAAERKAAT